MTGIAGTVTCFTSPATPVGAVQLEGEDQTSAELVRRHGAATMTRVAAAGLLAAVERDRMDIWEAATFGVDRSTPAPIPADAITAQLSAHAPAPATDEAGFDEFERRTFGLTR